MNVGRLRGWIRWVDTNGVLVVFLFALGLRLANWAAMGTRVSPDGRSYLGTCGAWSSDPVGTLQAWIGIETASFTIPMCTVVEWLHLGVDAWIFLQVVASALACVLLFDTLKRSVNPTAAWLGAIGLAGLWEIAQWDAYLLTESLFIFYLMFSLWAYFRWREVPTRSRMWVFFLFLFLVATTRGTGLFVAVGWFTGFLVEWMVRSSPQQRAVRWRTALVMALIGLLLVVGWVNMSGRADDYIGGRIADTWAQGTVVHDDPMWDYHYEAIPAEGNLGFFLANWYHVLVLGVLKVLALFLPFVPRFSAGHILVNSLTLIPLFLLAALGLVSGIRRRLWHLWPWLIPVAATLFWVSVNFVDYDWRYRVPILPSLIVLAVIWLANQGFVERIATRIRDFRDDGPRGDSDGSGAS